MPRLSKCTFSKLPRRRHGTSEKIRPISCTISWFRTRFQRWIRFCYRRFYISRADKSIGRYTSSIDFCTFQAHLVYIFAMVHKEAIPIMQPNLDDAMQQTANRRRCTATRLEILWGVVEMLFIKNHPQKITHHTKSPPNMLHTAHYRPRISQNKPFQQLSSPLHQKERLEPQHVESGNRTRVVATTMRNTNHCTNSTNKIRPPFDTWCCIMWRALRWIAHEEGGLCSVYPAASLQYQHGRNTALCCVETDVILVLHDMFCAQ